MAQDGERISPFAPDVSDAQLASLRVHQFEARGNLTTAAAQLENIIADRLSLAGVLDEQTREYGTTYLGQVAHLRL